MRGLSPIVSTIVLIVAAVVGGMMAYQYFVSTLSSISAKSIVTISQADVYDNRILFVNVDVFSKSNDINIEGLEIICGSNIKSVMVGDAGLQINGTSIIYVANNNLCSDINNMLVSVLYKEGNSGMKRTEPVKPIIH
ncbi:MAG: hypothetical protein ABWW69_06425 [Pyrodictiaceae archaeon]